MGEHMYSIEEVSEAMKEINNIEQRMLDDLSKQIFQIYLNNILYGGWMFRPTFYHELSDTVVGFNTLSYVNDVGEVEKIHSGESFVLYGAGYMAVKNIEICNETGINILYCVDSDPDKCGKYLEVNDKKYEIKPPSCLKDVNVRIIVSSIKFKDEITELLKNKGVKDQNIVKAGSFWKTREPQYFDFLKPREKECYVDVGGWIGDSVFDFVKWCEINGKEYEKIHVIEGDPINYNKLQYNLKEEKINKVNSYNCCAGSYNGESMFFSNCGCGSSSYSTETDGEEMIEVQIKSLDSILNGERCSFLKIDVEGAEMDVLVGARETIKTFKPRIAVCVYHRFVDILVLPKYLLSLVPEYHFYLRHYYSDFSETVLYAIPD